MLSSDGRKFTIYVFKKQNKTKQWTHNIQPQENEEIDLYLLHSLSEPTVQPANTSILHACASEPAAGQTFRTRLKWDHSMNSTFD